MGEIVLYITCVNCLMIAFQIFIFLKYYINRNAYEFLRGEKKLFDKKKRIAYFTFILCLTFSVVIIWSVKYFPTNVNYWLSFISVFVITSWSVFVQIIMIDYKIEKPIEKSEKKNQQLNRPDNESLRILYFGFKKNHIIDDNLTIDDFLAKFLIEPIRLNMDMKSFREFYELYIRVFKVNTTLFKQSFINSKGEIFDKKSFSNYGIPIGDSNFTEELDSIFSELMNLKKTTKKNGFS